jgi:hypothetical protein
MITLCGTHCRQAWSLHWSDKIGYLPNDCGRFSHERNGIGGHWRSGRGIKDLVLQPNLHHAFGSMLLSWSRLLLGPCCCSHASFWSKLSGRRTYCFGRLDSFLTVSIFLRRTLKCGIGSKSGRWLGMSYTFLVCWVHGTYHFTILMVTKICVCLSL